MAFSKQYLYNPTDQITSGFAHALSHPARLLIIKQLITHGPCAVQVIAEAHPIHKEALSGHLKILRVAGLVKCEERFPYTFYSIDKKNLKKAYKYLSDFLEEFKFEV